MGTIALANHAYALCRTSIGKGSVCKVRKRAWMATRCRKSAAERFSVKEVLIFNFNGPVANLFLSAFFCWDFTLPVRDMD